MSAFLKMTNIEGEANEKGHEKWIFVQSMSGSIVRSIPTGAKDQQRTRGETTVADLSIVRELDKSSPKLMEACAAGTFFAEAEVDFCTVINNLHYTYLKYKLFDVIITSYSIHADASGVPLPSEVMSLGYSKVEWTYFQVDPKTGQPLGHVPGKYDGGRGRGS